MHKTYCVLILLAYLDRNVVCLHTPSSPPQDPSDEEGSDDGSDDGSDGGGYYIMFRGPAQLMPDSCVFDQLDRADADK